MTGLLRVLTAGGLRFKDMEAFPGDDPEGVEPRGETEVGPQAESVEDAIQDLGGPSEGPSDDSDDLFDMAYSSIHRRAVRLMKGQPVGHTLDATALVNEAFLRLRKSHRNSPENRQHLLFTTVAAMRQILVDHARRKRTAKRGGDLERHPLDGIAASYMDRSEDIEALDLALKKLAEFDPRMAQVVELRFFGGRSMTEIGSLLSISPRTLDRLWCATRAWLYREIR